LVLFLDSFVYLIIIFQKALKFLFMTSSKKNNLQINRQKGTSRTVRSDLARYSELLDRYAQDMLLELLEGLEEILSLLPDDMTHNLDEVRLGIAKGLVFNTLIMIESDFLFRKPQYRPLLKRLKDSLCVHLFANIFQMPASGKDYEYFSCIFEEEYNQLGQELLGSFGEDEGIEKDAKVPNFNFGRDSLESWLPFLVCESLDDNLMELVSDKVKKLADSLQLKMTRALLS